jgi:hypothetical protein
VTKIWVLRRRTLLGLVWPSSSAADALLSPIRSFSVVAWVSRKIVRSDDGTCTRGIDQQFRMSHLTLRATFMRDQKRPMMVQ